MMKIFPTFYDVLGEFLNESCSICSVITAEGCYLAGDPLQGSWNYWACESCIEWLEELSEGAKLNGNEIQTNRIKAYEY